ncbi:hypothetical protein AA0472_0486 [Acetobacter estunensis NRIC 0472]|nr:hypothetical protein AA0472_0486 [Acetobacter estunensis NRIC 0472]
MTATALEGVLTRVFEGTFSHFPPAVREAARDGYLVSVSVAPGDLVDNVRERLLDDVVRAINGPERPAVHESNQELRALFWNAVEKAVPGSCAEHVQPLAPAPPIDAQPWQLADDVEEYGQQAGWWIVVDGTHANELSDAMPTRALAQHIADGINAADPTVEWHRHWFVLR